MNFKKLLLAGAFVLAGNAALAQTQAVTPASVAATPMATSNSPTYGHPNSPRQDG